MVNIIPRASHTHTHTHKHTRACTHTHWYIYTHTHTRARARARTRVSSDLKYSKSLAKKKGKQLMTALVTMRVLRVSPVLLFPSLRVRFQAVYEWILLRLLRYTTIRDWTLKMKYLSTTASEYMYGWMQSQLIKKVRYSPLDWSKHRKGNIIISE